MRRSGVGDVDRRIFLSDVHGLVHDRRSDLTEAQRKFAVSLRAAPFGPESAMSPSAATFGADGETLDLEAVVAAVRPTALIGVSGQGGIFTEPIIASMAAATERPIVMPLSNPTSQAEATPSDILAWSRGSAIVATGSPFDDVIHEGVRHQISQANNVYIFPGLGMGAVAARVSAVTDAMLWAAADALTECCPRSARHGVLPPLGEVRAVSHRIAVAVAEAAVGEGVAGIERDEIEDSIARSSFEPAYPDLRPGTTWPAEQSPPCR
jgi:malate dehydrogenase (oxaloacetate-decarboxylating)